MSRRQRNNKKDIIIDFTSLLDVTLILLLAVLCSYTYENEVRAAQADETQADQLEAIANANSNSDAYIDLIDTEDNLQKYVWSASIVVPYDPNEITLRHIKVLTEETDIFSIDLVGNDVSEALNEFKDSLTKYIEAHLDRPVILSLNENDDSILYRDEKAINEVLNELMKTYDNVYIKGKIDEE